MHSRRFKISIIYIRPRYSCSFSSAHIYLCVRAFLLRHANLRNPGNPPDGRANECPSSGQNIVNELLDGPSREIAFRPAKFHSAITRWRFCRTLNKRRACPRHESPFLLNFSRDISKEFSGKRYAGGKNMTCLLQSYFSHDGKYSPRKWTFSSPRWRTYSEYMYNTCDRASSRSRNGRWIAFAQLPTAEWRVICIIWLVEQLNRTPSVRSSALRISYSANGISSAAQSTTRVVRETHARYHLAPALTLPPRIIFSISFFDRQVFF